MGNKIRCKYHNSGFCKKGGSCKFAHPTGLCLKLQCQDKGCQFRHPRACRYRTQCRRRLSCMYKHSKYENLNAEEEIDKLKKKKLKS